MNPVIYKTATLAIISFFLALLLSRIIGRKLISQMTFFDFVIGVTLGSLTANLALSSEHRVLSSSTAMITLTLVVLLVDYGHLKSFFLRKLTESEPVALISNGKIVDKNMRKTRFTVNDLMMLLREKNVFNIADVEFALIETDGKLSVLPKSQKQPVTPSDLGISTGYRGLTKDLVIDGRLMAENLKGVNLDEQWLKNELKSYGVMNIKEVFYAGLDTAGNLYISKRQDKNETPGQYGIE
ncbi:MAG: DUF421 domain-containing protein [Clostridia bacterium]|nr:DUF421 domain-containing protein [Clostridia bacterium]